MERLRSLVFMWLGHCFVLIGIIGVFLPILPTTPFLLIACFCYERGSPEFHKALTESRYLGPYIVAWKKYHVIPVRAKVLALSMIVISITGTLIFAPLLLVKVGVAIIGASVSAYILMQPSRPREEVRETT